MRLYAVKQQLDALRLEPGPGVSRRTNVSREGSATAWQNAAIDASRTSCSTMRYTGRTTPRNQRILIEIRVKQMREEYARVCRWRHIFQTFFAFTCRWLSRDEIMVSPRLMTRMLVANVTSKGVRENDAGQHMMDSTPR